MISLRAVAGHPPRVGTERRFSWIVASLLAGLLAVPMAAMGALPVSADTRPLDPARPESAVTASPDLLPTVQIDGVVWQQTVIGNTVYAVGQFSNARPAGAAPGTDTTARANILAFDIRTGALITTFDASLNAQARSVTASPDGKRIYVGGAFTQVNGVERRYVAALDATTGALIPSFAPLVNSRVNAIVATPSAVYLGGWFSGVGSAKRDKLASVSPMNGSLLPWNPVVAGGDVTSLVISPDGSKAVAGGNFTSVNGSTNPGSGLAAINTTTAAVEPWAINSFIRNSGTNAAITSLTSDAEFAYASAYDYGNVSQAFEGIVSARWSDGELQWLEDCHGDTYSLWASPEVVYSASHAHYCGNVGGFPETKPRSYHHALAFGKTPVGTITRDTQGYRSFEGTPRSELLNWWPTFDVGSFTKQYQAAWSVTGNAQYVVMGGEFPSVNGVKQQGLARFGTGATSSNKEGPEVRGRDFNPTVISYRDGQARITWASNWDRDNRTLTYRVYRDGNLSTPIHEVQADSTFWQRPVMNFVDKGLSPGSQHTYRVFAVDAYGNEARSESVGVTVAAAGTTSAYAATVLGEEPTSFWRLGETSGTDVVDWAGFDDLTAGAGITRGQAGAITGDPNQASTFSGTGTGTAGGRSPQEAPDVFTSEAWIRTSTTAGGKIIGFGAAQSGNSSSYDRQTYMDNQGRIWFGVYPGTARTVGSSRSYNDGEWHHVVSSLGPAGMALHVDGQLIGKRSDTTSGQHYQGVWRVGGDNLRGWPSAPSSYYFNGAIDEVAVYPSQLSRSQIQAHYADSGREVTGPKKPIDAYGAAVYSADPDFYWRLGETEGTTASDASQGGVTGTYVSGITLGERGALIGVDDGAAGFDGDTGLLSSTARVDNPEVYSEELWFRTTTGRGGKLIGFGDTRTGLSGSYDRHVYMEDDGRLTFGVWTGKTDLARSTDSYNDGDWHHMVATQSGTGMALYVDGQVVATNPQTRAQNYSGYWKVGSDSTWGTQPYFAGTVDEVAVYPRALTADEVTDHYRLGGRVVETPNKAPVAAGSVTAQDLSVAADASASSDADGTVASYRWNFGDDTAEVAGVTASHTYGAAGTYQVVLTVTDDKGATDTLTRSVTVTAPPVPNEAPVAAGSVTAQDLSVAADASASSDADGTVASYRWNFGDDTAEVAGVTASHTYGAAGTYQVVLTVTDDKGATDTLTRSVTVTAPPVPTVVAEDHFDRSITSAWGRTEPGGAWSIASWAAAKYSVDNGAGVLMTTPGATLPAQLNSVSVLNATTTATFSLDKVADGGGLQVSLIGRRVPGAGEYRAKALLQRTGAVTIELKKRVGSTETLMTARAVSGLKYAAGDDLIMKLGITGAGSTEMSAKIWKAGSPEPDGWQVVATDATAVLQAPGSVGLETYLSGSATNAPVGFELAEWSTSSEP